FGSAPVVAGQLGDLFMLPADGTYAAQLEAVDSAGNRASDLTTFIVDTAPPTPPPALAATVQGRNVTLQWGPSSSADLGGYQVLRASGSGGMATIGTAGPGTLSFVDGPLSDGDYRYAVMAVRTDGVASEPSPQAQATVD